MSAGATVDATVRLQALDGTWETCGADRAIGVNPGTLTYSHNEWGADKASFDLHRSVIALWPDLGAFTPVEIEVGGVVVWEGRTAETPTRAGAEQVINVQGQGWQYQLDDDVYQRVYVHSKLTDWKDARSFLEADLTKFTTAPQVQAGSGGIVLSIPKEAAVIENVTCVGVVLDLGPGQYAARAVMSFSSSTYEAGKYLIACRQAETLAGLLEVGNTAWSGDPATITSPTAGTFPNRGRYVAILIVRTGATGAETADRNIKITAAGVYASTEYESGNASNLGAKVIVRDALERATLLLSSDFSQIATTTFPIPDFAMSKASTPREAIEAANAYHNYIAKLLIGRRVSYQPRPTDPTLEIGAWSGAEIEDASANNGAEIYNRALVEAQGPDGSPLEVERSASQQPGVQFTTPGSPAPENPSFATNTASWSISGGGALTRDTGTFHSAPASGKWVAAGYGETLTEQIAGAFVAGTNYRLTLFVRTVAGEETGQLDATLGVAGDHGIASVRVKEAFTAITIVWTPSQSYPSGVTLTLTVGRFGLVGSLGFYIDDLALTVAQPTLADRRSFRRTKVIQMSSVITPAEGVQLADIFLQGHMTTPFKGAVAVSPGGVRKVLGGQSVHPSQIGLHAQELLRVAHMTDPDTGGIGRDGTIAEVSYTHKDQKAQVTLDDKRGNFDALLARLAVVQSVGS